MRLKIKCNTIVISNIFKEYIYNTILERRWKYGGEGNTAKKNYVFKSLPV